MNSKKLQLTKQVFLFRSEKTIPGLPMHLKFEITIEFDNKSYSVINITKDFTNPLSQTKEYYGRMNMDAEIQHQQVLFYFDNFKQAMELVKIKMGELNIAIDGGTLGPECVGLRTHFGFYSREFQELPLFQFDDWSRQNKFLVGPQLNAFITHVTAEFGEKDYEKVMHKSMADVASVLRRDKMFKKLNPGLFGKLMEIFLYHDLKLEK